MDILLNALIEGEIFSFEEFNLELSSLEIRNLGILKVSKMQILR